jgi:uncharacterized membrane protein YkoI
MRKVIVSVWFVIILGSTAVPVRALSESDQELSEKATVSMIEAIKTAEQAKPGKAVEVHMGRDDGRVVYKIEILDGKKTHKVYVDAITGKVQGIR